MDSRGWWWRSRLFRLPHPPWLIVDNGGEKSLSHYNSLELLIGGTGGAVQSGFVNADAEYFPGNLEAEG